LDLGKLPYFFAVFEHRNLSAASQAVRVSQPTLTRAIQAFEAEFDTPLFVRSARGMSPTDAARRLHDGLQGLQRQLKALQKEIAESRVEPTGEVAFGIPPSPRNLLGVELVKRFTKAYPRVVIRLVEETSGQLRDSVASGLLDICVTNFFEPMRGIEAKPLAREPLMLVGPRQAKLSPRKPVTPRDLAALPLILTSHPNSLRLKVEAELGKLGLRPNLRLEANTLPLMTDLVEAGLGYTVLPASGIVFILNRNIVTAAPIIDWFLTWAVATPKTRPLSAAADKLVQLLFLLAEEKITEGTWLKPGAETISRLGGVRRQRQRDVS
jgi:LysR family nitrogen assimilation transcriptional regulator